MTMISLGSGICCEVSTHKSYHSGDFLLDFFLGGGEGRLCSRSPVIRFYIEETHCVNLT